MSWFKTGNEVDNKDNYATGKKIIPSFWMKVGRENARNIIFLDDPKFGFTQHTFKIGDDFISETCLGDECPACAAGYYGSFVLAFTILDLTPYVDKKTGQEVKYSKRMFIAKGKATKEKLDERRDGNGGTLAGLKFKVIRTDEKSTNCGDDFQVLGKVDLKKLPVTDPKHLEAFNYMEMFEPVSVGQMEAKIKRAAPPTNKAGKSKAKTISRDAFDDGFGPDVAATAEPNFNQSEDIPF